MDYKVQISNIKDSIILKDITKDSFNYITYNIVKNSKFNLITYIVENNFKLELTQKELEFYLKDVEFIRFPEWNIMPYDINSPNLRIQVERMDSIYKLLHYKPSNKKVILLIAKNSIIQKVINPRDYKFIKISVGDKISVNEFKQNLEKNCYEFVDTSLTIGNYSCNNDIIDLITFENKAYRIKFQNDAIKEIRSFAPDTQISFGNYEEILILPMKEVLLNSENIENFKQNYRNNFGIPAANEKENLYQNISNGIFYNGCENWLPLFYKNELVSIFDYIPSNSIFIYQSELMQEIKKFAEEINNYYNLRLSDNLKDYNPVKINSLYLSPDEVLKLINTKIKIIFDAEDKVRNEREIKLNFKKVPKFSENYKEIFIELMNFLDR